GLPPLFEPDLTIASHDVATIADRVTRAAQAGRRSVERPFIMPLLGRRPRNPSRRQTPDVHPKRAMLIWCCVAPAESSAQATSRALPSGAARMLTAPSTVPVVGT